MTAIRAILFMLFFAHHLVGDDSNLSSWPMHRGNPRLTGVVTSDLPNPLAIRWKYQASEPFTSSAAIHNGRAFVGCDDGFLYSLDLKNGSFLWKHQAKGPVQTSPLVADDKVIFGDEIGQIFAVDARTGQVAWTFSTEGQLISSPNRDGNRVVIGSYDGYVYCLQLSDGTLLWKFLTEGKVHGTPGIADNHVLIAGCDEGLHVLSLDDGKEVRRVSMGSMSGSSAAILGSRVFLGTYGNQVRCIDWREGKTIWNFEDPERQFPFMSSAAVTESVAIIGGRDKRLRCFDANTDAVRWTLVTGGRIDSSPIIAGKNVLAASGDGILYTLDLATGKELSRLDLGSPITASPAVAEGILVIGTQDGVLYGLGQPRS